MEGRTFHAVEDRGRADGPRRARVDAVRAEEPGDAAVAADAAAVAGQHRLAVLRHEDCVLVGGVEGHIRGLEHAREDNVFPDAQRFQQRHTAGRGSRRRVRAGGRRHDNCTAGGRLQRGFKRGSACDWGWPLTRCRHRGRHACEDAGSTASCR